MLLALRQNFLPSKVVLLRPADKKNDLLFKIAPFIKEQKSPGEETRAFVCKDFSCNLPTADIQKMLLQLGRKKK